MKQRKKLIMLCGLMLAVSSPTYAENATEAVSISDTASVVELTSDANMETEMQSVSDSDTTETSAQETDQVALPAIWQETYTYLADTQDAHTFPEQIEKSGTSYQLKDVQYQITGIAWDSDGWQDENGGWWKSVKATGNRMIKRSRAWFSGEVAEVDLPMVRYTSHYVSDVTGYLITANVNYEEILPEPESTVAETEAELVTQTPETEAETVSEQAQVESVSDSDTNKTIAGMPWQDLVLLFLETGSVALGLIMIGLLAKFRPKPRAWINTKKENKQKGEK